MERIDQLEQIIDDQELFDWPKAKINVDSLINRFRSSTNITGQIEINVIR